MVRSLGDVQGWLVVVRGGSCGQEVGWWWSWWWSGVVAVVMVLRVRGGGGQESWWWLRVVVVGRVVLVRGSLEQSEVVKVVKGRGGNQRLWWWTGVMVLIIGRGGCQGHGGKGSWPWSRWWW